MEKEWKFNEIVRKRNVVNGGARVPGWTAREFSELKNIPYKTLLGKIRASSLKPNFIVKRTRYYALSDLNEWFNSL